MDEVSEPGFHDEEPEPLVPIRIVGYDAIPPQYANEIYVASDPMGLHLVFTRFLPPPIATESDQQRVDEIGFVPNEVVARVVIPPYVANRLLRLIPERLEKHREFADELGAMLEDEQGEGNNDAG